MDNAIIGVIFGLIAMLGFGLSNAIAVVPIKKEGSVKTLFFRSIIVCVLLLAVLLFYISETNFSGIYIIIALLISLIGYIPMLSFYKALKIGKAGIVSPIANSSLIFTVLLSVVFFKEHLSIMQIFSVILILFGIILISINFKDLKNSDLFNISSGIPYALISCFLWGIVFFLIKIPVMVIGPILTSFIIESGNLMWSATHLKISKSSFSLPSCRILKYIFLAAFFILIGLLAFNYGIKIHNVSLIAAITAANPLVTTMYAKFAYREKLSFMQWFAILLILCGIVCISYF